MGMNIDSPSLSDLERTIRDEEPSSIWIRLPGGEQVPAHFHVTEVGRVQKDFIDCGGTPRSDLRGQLQLLVATDFDHRLSPEKLLGIIEKSRSVLGNDELPLAVEYGQKVAVVYAVGRLSLENKSLGLELVTPETACLAPDRCGLPDLEPKLTVAAGGSAPRWSLESR